MGDWTFDGPNPIVSYTVGLEFDRALSSATLRQISALHGSIKRDLPRRIEQQAITFQMGIGVPAGVGGSQGPRPDLGGVVFDHLLPDGKALSSLGVSQGTVQYMLSQYSRWAEFWPVAERLLAIVGNVALQEVAVRAVQLIANNRFVASDTKIELPNLIKQSAYIAPHVLKCSNPCHSFHGYQVANAEPPGQRIDNVLLSVGYTAEGKAFAELNFNLRLILNEAITEAATLFRQNRLGSLLASTLEKLHGLNNTLIRDILVEGVSTSIPGLSITC
jgi:hypothetical protein